MKFLKKKPASEPSGRRRPTAKSTGSLSFSYYASRRSAVPAYKAERKAAVAPPVRERLAQFSRQAGLVALGLVLLACAISLLQVDSQARVVIVNNAQSYALHPTTVYQQAASQALHSSLVNSNKITINTQAITAKLKHAFPEIDDVTIVLPLVGHRPVVYIQLTRPVAILVSKNQSVVMDSSGNALATANHVEDLQSFDLPTVVDQSQRNLRVGDKVLPKDSVDFLQILFNQLAAQHIDIGQLSLPAGAEELDVRIAGQPYFVKFNLHDGSPKQQIGTFLAVRQHLTQENKTPGQYIDVRVPGRAYYL